MEKIWGEEGGRRRVVVGWEVGMVGDSDVVKVEVLVEGVGNGRIASERGGSG